MTLPKSMRRLAELLEDETMARTKRGAMCCSGLFGIIAGLLEHQEIREQLKGTLVRTNNAEVMADVAMLRAFLDDIVKSASNLKDAP